MSSQATTATTSPRPGTGHQGQTFLVGTDIYIRAMEVADAARGQSLTASLFPRSSSRHKSWIKKEMPKQQHTAYYTIVRKADDVPVGSIRTWRYDPKTQVTVSIDPLYGDRGLAWKAEAIRLVVPWLGDEQHRPMLSFKVPSNEQPVIEALEASGVRQAARYREHLLTWGGRTDALVYEYPNLAWVERLGDPLALEAPRSGTGETRPVPELVTLNGDPPANAMKIGPRVCLRPMAKPDAAQLARWTRQDPETFWDAGRWMQTTPGTEHRISEITKADPHRDASFSVCLRETDDLIGTVAIHGIDYLHGFAESASQMYNPAFRGCGYGSEAKHLLFDYAFNDLKLHSLYSTVIYPNTRSAAALRKQGYREAGNLHWEFASFGTFENFVTFDLLAADWRAMPRITDDAQGDRS